MKKKTVINIRLDKELLYNMNKLIQIVNFHGPKFTGFKKHTKTDIIEASLYHALTDVLKDEYVKFTDQDYLDFNGRDI